MALFQSGNVSKDEGEEGISVVAGYVWDSIGLAWVRAVQVDAGGGGSLTDAELRATPVPVSGTVSVGTVPVTGPLTDAQLRAVAVPVSGTVAVNVGLTDAQLRATPVPVSGTVTITDGSGVVNVIVDSGVVTSITNPVAVTGSFFQATQPVSAAALPLPAGAATLAEQQTQTTALQLIDNIVSGAGANITQQGGVNISLNTGVRDTGTQRVTIATNDLVPVTGTLTAVTSITNSVAVTGTFWQATQPVSGTFWQATQPVSGTFWQATQPVSGTVAVSGSVAVTGPLTDAQLRASAVPVSGTFFQGTQPVSGTFWQATQPVSGTVAVSTLPVDTYTAKDLTISASGDTTVHDPAGGLRVRLHYIVLNADGANSADVTVIVKFGAVEQYKLSLKAGAIWARNIGAGRRYIQGAVDANLVVNLSATQTVHTSIEYEEV